MKKIRIAVLLSIIQLISLSLLFSENRFSMIYIINDTNKTIPLKVEIAETNESRAKGLMFRKKLNENYGMLFVFNREEKLNFWMKNTYIPLSIAYINKSGIITEILDMQPLDTTVTYPSQKPSKYALEVSKDWFKINNISAGCRIKFDGCFGKQD